MFLLCYVSNITQSGPTKGKTATDNDIFEIFKFRYKLDLSMYLILKILENVIFYSKLKNQTFYSLKH